MHAMFVEDLARAHIDELAREADAHRLAHVALRARRASRAGRGAHHGLMVHAWRRALAAVALSVVAVGGASAALA